MASPLPRLPRRESATNKGDYGHVFVVAGSVGMTGAASLTAEAAVRSGAGLVYLLCPEGTWTVLASSVREVLVRPVGPGGARSFTPEAVKDVESFVARTGGRPAAAGKRAVIALGPGMGRERGAEACARGLALKLEHPLVLDADGLNAFEGRAKDIAGRARPTVLTPHPGEACRLVGEFDGRDDAARRDAAVRLARAAGSIVILKGHRSVVTDGERVEINETGNPGMASGGVGDVLTGVVAGLMAVGMDAFDAARLGAHVHGLAGNVAAKEIGETSLAAGDILRHLPAAFMRIERGDQGLHR